MAPEEKGQVEGGANVVAMVKVAVEMAAEKVAVLMVGGIWEVTAGATMVEGVTGEVVH